MMLTLVITKESNIKMQNAWKHSFVKANLYLQSHHCERPQGESELAP
jgi:hypothetical protein